MTSQKEITAESLAESDGQGCGTQLVTPLQLFPLFTASTPDDSISFPSWPIWVLLFQQQPSFIQNAVCHNLSAISKYRVARSRGGWSMRCINIRFHWSPHEGWGDWTTRNGKQWINVRSQRTGPLLWMFGCSGREWESASAAVWAFCKRKRKWKLRRIKCRNEMGKRA